MPNYPGSIDDDVSLFLAVNNARTRLTSSISTSDLTIPVVTTSGFPNQGFITILTNPDDITEAEAIRYEGLTPTTFSGVERGAGGTFPYVHAVGNFVDLTVMAEHHNELKDAIIELEKIVGVSGSHNFVPKDAQGNAIVSGTLTAQGLLDAGWITTSGSAVICGPGFFKEDVYFAKNTSVSGIATFGVLPSSTVPEAVVVFDDVGGTGTGTSYTTQLTTDPLPSGDNLVLYRANMGWDPTSTNTGQMAIRSIFAGLEIGLGEGNTSVKAGHGHGAEVAGFKVVSGDGVNTASIQTRALTSSGRIYQWGAAGIVSIPLGEMGLVENTDYWYDNGSDVAQGTSSTTMTTYNTLNFTVPDAGDYVFFFTTEMDAGIQSRTRFRMDGTVVFSQAESGATGERAPGAGAVVVSLTAGAHSATFQQSCNNAFASSSDTYRSRMFVLRAASFSQVQFSRSATDQASASATAVQLSNVGSISHTPLQSEQVLILGTAGHFSTNDDTSASYQITNTTDAEPYAIDSGMRVYNNASEDVDNRQSFFFRTLEDVSTTKDFELQHRRYNGASTTTTTDAALVVLGLSQPNVDPDEPVTTINGNTITTHEIIADVITTDTFNTENVTVTGVLDVSTGVSYLGQTFAYELSANDIVASGTLTVSGTSCFVDDVDFKADITVSGVATFGQDNTPPSANGDIIFASQDTEQTTSSTSFVDAGCETDPLADGVEYLIIYSGNFGIDSTSISVESQTMLGSTRIGRSGFAKSALGTFGDNAYNASYCHGIYRATGNGTDTVKFQYRSVSGSQTAYAGAMSIICVPLDNYTQNTDYYWVETTNSDTPVVTNAAVADPPNTSLLSDTFTGMSAGDWLFIFSAEGNVNAGATRGASVRFQVDSTTVGTSRYTWVGRSAGTLTWNSTAAANIVSVAGGDTDVETLVSSTTAFALADFYRGRIFAIKKSLFTQMVSSTDTTGDSTSSSSFVDFSGLDTSITPTSPNAPLIVLATAPSYTQENNSGFTSALRNETDAVNYRDDSGGREDIIGGTGSALVGLSNSFMSHFEERSAATEYRYQYRSVGTGPVAVGRDDSDSGGEHSELIIWEFLDSSAPVVPITQTVIDDDEIQTGTIIADQGQFVTSLTISGVPVTTGTGGGGGPVGDFVERSGDSMTGTLDMQGNNIYNTGVVAMQEETPVITTSGLLWFDTDAPGHAGPSNVNLPGGFLGALLTNSSGTDIVDDGSFHHVAWDTTEYDKGGWVDPAYDKRLIVPSGVTHVQITAGVRFDSNATGDRRIAIAKNTDVGLPSANQIATSIDDSSTTGGTPYVQTVTSPVLTVSGGDYFSLAIRQTSGGNLAIDTLSDVLDTFFSAAAVDTRGIPGVNSLNLLQGDLNLVAGSGVSITSNSQSGQIEVGLHPETFQDLQIWSPDAPPSVPTAWDDEFNYALGGQWTDWDPGSVTTSEVETASQMLRVRHNPPSSAATLGGIFQSSPSNDFTVYAKFHYLNNISVDFHEFGLLFAEDLTSNPSTANFGVISVPAHRSSGETESYYFGFATQHFSAYNSFDTNKDFRAIQFPANEPIYVRARVSPSARTVIADASMDGITWRGPVSADFSGDLTTIDEIGIWANSASTTEMIVEVDFLRVVEHTSANLPMQGGFVTLSGIPERVALVSGTGGSGNITDINSQTGPSISVVGAGTVDVITTTNVLTISGTGTGGGVADLQGAYDGGDGGIETSGGKPVVLSGTGELVAVTGTFTDGLTVGTGSTVLDNHSITTTSGNFQSLTISGVPVSTGTGGGASLDPSQDQTITGNWDFQSGLTKSGVTVATQDDLSQVTTSGFASVISGTIVRPLSNAHSPLGLWNFDGDFTDSSGNGNDLTEEVGTTDIIRISPYLSAARFGGNSLLVSGDVAAFKLTGDITIEAIIIYAADTKVAVTKTIAGQCGPSGDGVDADNFLGRLALNTTDHIQYFAEESGGTNISFTGSEEISGLSRTIHHVVMVRESNEITFYVDGQRKNTSSGLSAPVGGANTRFRIGADINTGAGSNFFTGAIASVKYLDFALTDYQVRKEYESTLSTATIPEEFTTISGAFSQSLTISGVPVSTGTGGGGSFDPSENQTITGEWEFSNSLTISGSPVATGTIGGGSSSLDEAQVALLSQVFGA